MERVLAEADRTQERRRQQNRKEVDKQYWSQHTRASDCTGCLELRSYLVHRRNLHNSLSKEQASLRADVLATSTRADLLYITHRDYLSVRYTVLTWFREQLEDVRNPQHHESYSKAFHRAFQSASRQLTDLPEKTTGDALQLEPDTIIRQRDKNL